MTAPVSSALFGRLSASDVDRVVENFDAEETELWNGPLKQDPVGQRQVLLHLAAYYDDKIALQKTGLTTAMPPDDVHSTARGKLSAGGSLYYGDLVMGVLEDAGITLPKQAKVLDFGSSSGRVLRVLHAYRPDIVAHGCDVNEKAIKWASQELPGMSFDVSPLRPPLPYGEKSFDMAFAISMWSHFNEATAQAWLDEMLRILKPGGVLLFTTHGLQSVNHFNQLKAHPQSNLDAVLRGLLTQGFSFQSVFGKEGDWGVVDNDWGNAFMLPSWLAVRLAPNWEMLSNIVGNVEGNQDTVVLRAR
jgi:SAM-dependent methyltransferase